MPISYDDISKLTPEELEELSKRVDMGRPLSINLPLQPKNDPSRSSASSPEGEIDDLENGTPEPQSQQWHPAVKDYITKKYGFQDDLSDEALKQAQEQARDSQLAVALGRAGATIGAAIGGTKIDDAGFDALSKASGRNVDNIMSRRKGVAEEQSIKLNQMKVSKESALHDPNSSESQSFRKIIEANFPKIAASYGNSWNEVTAADKELIFEPIKLKESINARLQAAQLAAEARHDAQAEKRTREARLSDKQTESVTSFDKAISAIDSVMAQKATKGWDTGALSFGMNKVAGWVGLDDAQKSAFKADVGEQLAQYIKSISGATVSERERAALLENVPSVYDNDTTFMTKANALRNRLVQNRELELGSYQKQGKDVSAWVNEGPKVQTYTEAQEEGIERVMQANDVSREEAIKALKEAGKL